MQVTPLTPIRFKDLMESFANGRKSRYKARWKKKVDRQLKGKYMLVFYK